MFPENTILPSAEVRVNDSRYARLLRTALARIPQEASPVRTVTRIHLRKRSMKRDLAGLTRYRYSDDEPRHGTSGTSSGGGQTITFYMELLNQLSDDAALAVVVHELAHAWLNEHKIPEESEAREREADELARRWGFGHELDILSGEVE